MTTRRPIVLLSGLLSVNPSGDVVLAGNSATEVIGGSGLFGGNFVSSNPSIGISLSSQPSGLVFSDNLLANDGAALVNAGVGYASGVEALSISQDALSSGNSALSTSVTALASGNAALEIVAPLSSAGTVTTLTAAADISAGDPVGINDAGQIETVRRSAFRDSGALGISTQMDFNGIISAYPLWDSGLDLNLHFIQGTSGYLCMLVSRTHPGGKLEILDRYFLTSVDTDFGSAVYNPNNSTYLVYFTNVAVSSRPYVTSFWFDTKGIPTIHRTLEAISGDNTRTQVKHVYCGRGRFVLACTSNGTNLQAYLMRRSGGATVDSAIITLISGPTLLDNDYQIYWDYDNEVLVAIYRDTTVNLVYAKTFKFDWNAFTLVDQSITTQLNLNAVAQNELKSTYDSDRKLYVAEFETWGSRSGITPFRVNDMQITVLGSGEVFDTGNTTVYDILYDAHNKLYYSANRIGSSYHLHFLQPSGEYGFEYLGNSRVYGDIPSHVRLLYHPPTAQVNQFTNINSKLVSFVTPPAMFSGVSDPKVNDIPNFVGVAKQAAVSGDLVTVLLPGSTFTLPSGNFISGKPVYVAPCTSSFTQDPYPPVAYSGNTPWEAVGIANSASGVSLINSF